MSVRLEAPNVRWEQAFLEAVSRSRTLHRGLVSAPRTKEQFRAYLARLRGTSHVGHLVATASGQLAGVVNLNEIVLGNFRSAYLGYYALAPHAGQGNMAAGVRLAVADAFRRRGLHRLEANIQPRNARSIALVRGLGFRLEGLSPRYLKIAGRWRDHERWALTIEDWKSANRRLRSAR